MEQETPTKSKTPTPFSERRGQSLTISVERRKAVSNEKQLPTTEVKFLEDVRLLLIFFQAGVQTCVTQKLFSQLLLAVKSFLQLSPMANGRTPHD